MSDLGKKGRRSRAPAHSLIDEFPSSKRKTRALNKPPKRKGEGGGEPAEEASAPKKKRGRREGQFTTKKNPLIPSFKRKKGERGTPFAVFS